MFCRSTPFLFALILLLSTNVHSQTTGFAAQENSFADQYRRLMERQDGGDDIADLSKQFTDRFTAFIKANPASLRYPFQKLTDSSYMYIRTSADGNFRMYSWDTWTGGTMHFFKTIYQWQDKGKIYSRLQNTDEADAGSFVSRIFTVMINGRPHYLAVTNAIGSSKDTRQSITVYTTDGARLSDTARLFRTRTKRLSRIDVDFDFFSVVDWPERPLELIRYDERQQIVYIPVVNEQGKVTGRNIVYRLKGGAFGFTGFEGGK